MTNFVSTGATNYANNTAFTVGKKPAEVSCDFTITAAALTNGDTFELAQVGLSDRISEITGTSTALTAATDNDLGFYTKDEDGDLVEIDKDILWNGVTLAAALDSSALMNKLNTALDTTKTVGDHISKNVDQDYANGVFLVLTMNVKSTANGSIHWKVKVEDGTAK